MFGPVGEYDVDITEYQKFTTTTAMFRGKAKDFDAQIMYCMLGLIGEIGEVAEKLKKKLRGGGELTEFIKDVDIAKEFGDVIWYWSQAIDLLGWDASDVLQLNIDKLKDRQKRGVVHGEGDNR